METFWAYASAIIPTIVALTLFGFLIKAMIEGDRRERIAQRQWEDQHPTAAPANPGDDQPSG